MFPEAQIVHLIRDGRDCVASLKAMPWFQQDIYAAISIWMEAIGCGRRAARRLPAGTYIELQYEQLAADPAEQLAALCEFLGEEYDPAMTEPCKISGIAIPERQTWHAGTRGQVTPALCGSWQERLEPWEVALCETVMGGRLRALGYELSGAPRPPAPHLTRFARVDVLRRGAAHKHRIRDRLQRIREPGPLEYQL